MNINIYKSDILIKEKLKNNSKRKIRHPVFYP